MDNFRIIHKILKALETAMDYDEFDMNRISAEALTISQKRWDAIMEMLADNGYVKGVSVLEFAGGDRGIKVSGIRITLKGLEYLNDNTLMKKAANIAKGIKDSIPGI